MLRVYKSLIIHTPFFLTGMGPTVIDTPDVDILFINSDVDLPLSGNTKTPTVD